jgi:hypothetical protein
VVVAVALDAAGERPLGGAGPAVIDPASRFRVDIAVPLLDARLSLVDASGAMVAAQGDVELGSSWARFSLAPSEPLAAGSDYALRLDGAVAAAMHDGDGRAYAPAQWPVRTAGEKPRPEPQRKRRAR